MVQTWEKKGYRLSFINVTDKVEKCLMAVLPFGTDIHRRSIDVESAIAEEQSAQDVTSRLPTNVD